MLTASGLIVRFLKVFEKSNYHSIKWVRYLTKASGSYQIRVSLDVIGASYKLTSPVLRHNVFSVLYESLSSTIVHYFNEIPSLLEMGGVYVILRRALVRGNLVPPYSAVRTLR